MTTDSSSCESAGELRLSCTAYPMATCGDYCEASQMPKVCAREAFDERSCNRSSPDEGSEALAAVATLWVDVPVDILGTVLRLLPCVADRASVRSVCRHWRAAARVQALPAPLPILVLPRFRFSCLTSDGRLTGARRTLMPVEVAGDDVWIVGSCDDWLMASRPSWHAKETTGAECFLVHAFSSEVVRLPCLQQSPCSYNWLDESRSARPIQIFFNGTNEQNSWAVLWSAILSASPSSGSKYIVAALCYHTAESGLALWQPGMTSWYLCRSAPINSMMWGDLAFYEGKLYMVWKYTPDIFAFELREDEHGVNLSCPEQYKIEPLIIPSNPTGWMRCNMVVWRGKLLLIIRFFSDSTYKKMDCKPLSVEVYALDFSTSPCGVTQIHNFDGDCIFVQKSSCRSFSAGLHAGVVQGDLIYFLDGHTINHVSYTYAHNMRDGTLRRFAAGLPLSNSGVPKESCLDFPVWIFPS